MFEVRKYEPPHIFVTDRGTGETYKLFVGSDGALTRDEARFNQGICVERRSHIWLRERESK
jgi:hypothetical protein